MTSLNIKRTDSNSLQLRLVALKFSRRLKALRWKELPPGKAKRETLQAAITDGVIIRRITRALAKLQAGPVKRTDYYREQKARKRAALALEGGSTISIRLTATEQAFFRKCFDLQNGPSENYLKRALLVGLAFTANSGNQRGGKNHIKKTDMPK